MIKTWGQALRHTLDLPLRKRSFAFWLAAPLLYPCSLLFALTAWLRRKRGYTTFDKFVQARRISGSFPNLRIFCIGNVLVGGTGKSPIVQSMALSFLRQGLTVAILSRGVGRNLSPFYAVWNETKPDGLWRLSDENREHYEILSCFLKEKNKDTDLSNALVYILQDKNRQRALNFLLNELQAKKRQNDTVYVLLDDGLQHFPCPREINLCVWSPRLLLQSPPFALPLGPYREGFGKQGMAQLLCRFPVRIWSRTLSENRAQFQNQVVSALARFAVSSAQNEAKSQTQKNITDLIAIYQPIHWQATVSKGQIRLEKPLDTREMKQQIEERNQIGIVTGIGDPQRFLDDLHPLLQHKPFACVLLGDHAPLNPKAIECIKKTDLLFLTLKDVCRWVAEPGFCDLVHTKKMIVSSPQIRLENMQGQEFLPEKLLAEGFIQYVS